MPKKSKYTEEQIIHALREVDAGARVQDIVRRLGVSEQTFYRWKSKYGGMDVPDTGTSSGRACSTATTKSVAERMGIDAPALSRLETGKMLNPTLATLHKWAEALGQKLDVGLSS